MPNHAHTHTRTLTRTHIDTHECVATNTLKQNLCNCLTRFEKIFS